MLNLDTTVTPTRPSDWAALVDAILRAEPQDEQTWLEWKSSLDLRSKTDLAAIAKCLIAMANRDPKDCQAVGGLGVMVIGVEPGAVHGVEPRDNAELEQALSPYIGPRLGWTPHWLTRDGKSVLILVVPPPQPGDEIHVIRNSGEKVTDGQVYVRKTARSVPATSADMDRLQQRLVASAATLDIRVEATPERDICPTTWDPEVAERVIEAERHRLIGPLPRTSSTYVALGVVTIGVIPEDRNEGSYRADVDTYLAAVRQDFPEIARGVSASHLPHVRFTAVNASGRNYSDLLVKVHVNGGVTAIDGPPKRPYRVLLPAAPRVWGSRSVLDGLARLETLAHTSFGDRFPRTGIVNGGSATLTFPVMDLRPFASQTLNDEIVLIFGPEEPTPLRATWTATATNVDAQASGSFGLDVAGESFDVGQDILKQLQRTQG